MVRGKPYDPLALTSTVPLKKSFWPLADNCAISPVVAGEFDAASGPRRSKLCPRADSALLFIRLGLQTQSLTFEVHKKAAHAQTTPAPYHTPNKQRAGGVVEVCQLRFCSFVESRVILIIVYVEGFGY